MSGRLLAAFAGRNDAGQWRIARMPTVCGEALPPASHLSVGAGDMGPASGASWMLRGVTSNSRYTTGAEQTLLSAKSPQLGRADATCAALIPIRKNAAWWDLPQDARRAIFEERSRHIAIGMDYLPAVARRLHHCRDLNEPFDFLTWFEYAPSDADAFEHMVERLRKTEEWRYVDREIDIRLIRDGAFG